MPHRIRPTRLQRTANSVASLIGWRVEAGLKILGENYVQEAEKLHRVIGGQARWHMIGHLQSNKAKKAVEIFS